MTKAAKSGSMSFFIWPVWLFSNNTSWQFSCATKSIVEVRRTKFSTEISGFPETMSAQKFLGLMGGAMSPERTDVVSLEEEGLPRMPWTGFAVRND